MSEKYYYENPKVSDTIIFDIYTPDANCCFNAEPFEVVTLKVYFVERNFSTDFYTQISANIGSPELEKNYLEAAQNICVDPNNPDYQSELKKTKRLLLNSANFSDLQFDNLITVAVFGSEENPVWQSSNPNDSILYKVIDLNSNIIYGHFGFKFQQQGLRDGDYFLAWNWRPNVSLQKLSSSLFFSLSPDNYKYVVPSNFITDKNKYPDLLNRYLPEMYKETLSPTDVSPEVLSKFNLAVGDAFANVENLANNISSLIDYNLIPEYFLAYLGNLYRLSFSSNDPIRWRRQIAKAVPNFKMKGTLKGLKSALGDAGIILNKFSQLYQVYSKYTWTDVFYISEPQSEFELSKISLPINNENFEVYLRVGNGDFIQKPLNHIMINTYNFVSILYWVGPNLNSGDTIKIVYQYEPITNPVEQSLEVYLRNLPLADTRNDLNVTYPPKNWNARVIEQDDPFFNEIIPVKNPFHDPVVFGQIRTDFAYSENIYNMDEYNGSLRDSNNPCDIDKNFIDPCSGFATTLFNCNLSIEDLSPDRINEALLIIREYKPFHAILHSLNYNGTLNDYLIPPEENIEILVSYYGSENLLANYPQVLFNRDMFLGLTTRSVARSFLASQNDLGTETVTGFNQKIVLYSPLVNFETLGVNYRTNTFLEILSPSPNQGNFTVVDPNKNYIEIYEQALITQPINKSEFAYRLSNISYAGTDIDIDQKNVYVFSDPILEKSILDYNVESEKTNPANPWKIKYYTSYPTTFNVYIIENINSDGSVVLKDDLTLPSLAQGLYINDINYELLNSSNDSIYTSFDGKLFCYNYGIVTVNDANFGDKTERVKLNYWLYYTPLSQQYQIVELGFEQNTFVICSWNNGNVTGQSGKILNRIVDDTTGNLEYKGMVIVKPSVIPAIEDPTAPNAVENNQFKENFILLIDGSIYKIDDYYTETSVDYLVLGGLKVDLTTQLAGGTSLSVQSIQLVKNEFIFPNNGYKLVSNEEHAVNNTTKTSVISLQNVPVIAGSIKGSIYIGESFVQSFTVSASGIFTFNDSYEYGVKVLSGEVDFATGTLAFHWNNPSGFSKFVITYQYAYEAEKNVCFVDRNGFIDVSAVDQDGMTQNICNGTPFAFNANLIASLENQGENGKFDDIIKQEEKIGFKIETADGKTYEGQLS